MHARRVAVTALSFAAWLLLVPRPAGAAEQRVDPRLAELDRGPARIDISAYPRLQRENYLIFADKCSRCHSLARPINAPYVLPEDWERYVKKMMRKPGSGLDPKSAKRVYEFLTFDASVRKKALLEKKRGAAKP